MSTPDPSSTRRQPSQLRGLRLVLVLSFIGSGSNTLSYLASAALLPQISDLYESGGLPLPDYMQVAIESFLSMPRLYFVLCALLSALSLTGAILMWNPRRMGFHLYTLAQLLLIAVDLLFMGKAGANVGNLMMTILFITFYFMALRSLGVFTRNNSTDSTSQSDPTDQP